MAKLPPKIPTIVHLSHDHSHGHHNQWTNLSHENLDLVSNPQQPWVDEFMEFSAAKRTSHRRSVSESSVAFIEAGTVPFLGPLNGMDDNVNGVINKSDHFDKFDDEQFMSMFSNDIGGGCGSSSNPSSTSDHNSTNEDQRRKGSNMGGSQEEVKATTATVVKNEADEVESSCQVDKGDQQGVGCVGSVDNNLGGENGNDNACEGGGGAGGGSDQQETIDPKRFKRILANRQSAQRSRVRKLQYISELERSVTALQTEVSILSPRVAFLDHQRMILNVDNNALKAKIAALAQDKIFKDAHQEALKRDIERLRQVYYQQNLQKTEGMVTPQPDTIVNENDEFTG